MPPSTISEDFSFDSATSEAALCPNVGELAMYCIDQKSSALIQDVHRRIRRRSPHLRCCALVPVFMLNSDLRSKQCLRYCFSCNVSNCVRLGHESVHVPRWDGKVFCATVVADISDGLLQRLRLVRDVFARSASVSLCRLLAARPLSVVGQHGWSLLVFVRIPRRLQQPCAHRAMSLLLNVTQGSVSPTAALSW